MGDLGDHLCDTIRAADEAARFRLDTFHRLVYADWLERLGDSPRAMAVRLHAAIEENRPGLVLPLAGPLQGTWESFHGWRQALAYGRSKLAVLCARNRRLWRQQFPRAVRSGLGLRAGLPWSFHGAAAAWPREPTGELSLVRSWVLRASSRVDPTDISPGMLRGAWEVVLAGPGWKGHVTRLLDSGVIPSGIRVFGLVDGALDPGESQAILRRVWPALQVFRANANRLKSQGAEVVWKELAHTRVRELDLSRNNIGLATGFLCHGGPPGLRVLHYGGNHTEARGTRAIAAAPFLGRVTRVDWMGNSLGAKGAEAMASWKVPRLRALHLATNHLGPEGARVLAKCPWLSKLSELDLSDNKLRDEGIGELSKALGVKMRALGLEDNLLEVPAAAYLANCPARESLFWLDLKRNRLGAGGLASLAGTHWPRLRHAGLMLNEIPPDADFPKGRFPRLGKVALAKAVDPD